MLSVTEHLAVYSTFHRALRTRLLHVVFVPLIFLSGAVFFALARAAIPTAILLCVLVALIDGWGALALAAWLVPVTVIATVSLARLPFAALGPAAAVVQLVSWAVMVNLGHQRFEPKLKLPTGDEDSNLYFRRSYFTAANLGVEVRAVDRLLQFVIAPLAVTHDLLLWAGLRRSLEERVATQRRDVVARLERGEAPLGKQAQAPSRRLDSAQRERGNPPA